jgi:3'-phosphoadenosine 5'-phosphosulfate sulfotransferase (PAPS reductase)/FAD synthetase
MKHIVCFSGGKDSTALVLWAKENLPEFTAVFCDTGWEHPITYAYVEEINQSLLAGELVVLKSEKYPGGFVQLSVERKRVPSAMARFCTQELKVFPMIAWLKLQDDECTVYQGIRAEESPSRAAMLERQWSDDYDAWVERPLLRWPVAQVFELMQRRGVKPNPLYLMGAGRVGCFPCIMVNFRELRAVRSYPDLWEFLKLRLRDLERRVGRSFWSPDDIPERFHSGRDKNGKSFCWAEDVFRYLESVDEDQLPLLQPRSCMSVYNLCE